MVVEMTEGNLQYAMQLMQRESSGTRKRRHIGGVISRIVTRKRSCIGASVWRNRCLLECVWARDRILCGLTIEYADRQITQIPPANFRIIFVLVHSLISSIHHARVVCYTDRHSFVIAAMDSTLDQRIGWTPYSFAASIHDACV